MTEEKAGWVLSCEEVLPLELWQVVIELLDSSSTEDLGSLRSLASTCRALREMALGKLVVKLPRWEARVLGERPSDSPSTAGASSLQQEEETRAMQNRLLWAGIQESLRLQRRRLSLMNSNEEEVDPLQKLATEATIRGRLDVLAHLFPFLSPGEDPRLFEEAASSGRTEVLEWLLAHLRGGLGEEIIGRVCLNCAARAGQLDTVRWLLLNNLGDCGSALWIAVRYDRRDVARLLTDRISSIEGPAPASPPTRRRASLDLTDELHAPTLQESNAF